MTTRIVTDSNGRKHITAEPLLHPPQRTWVGLTAEDVNKIVDENTTDDHGYDIWCDGRGVARAIEAKLKEKNT
jgi:hypothetical protein